MSPITSKSATPGCFAHINFLDTSKRFFHSSLSTGNYKGLCASWVLCLLMATVWMKLARNPLCLALTIMSSFPLSYRFLCGSFGAYYHAPGNLLHTSRVHIKK